MAKSVEWDQLTSGPCIIARATVSSLLAEQGWRDIDAQYAHAHRRDRGTRPFMTQFVHLRAQKGNTVMLARFEEPEKKEYTMHSNPFRIAEGQLLMASELERQQKHNPLPLFFVYGAPPDLSSFLNMHVYYHDRRVLMRDGDIVFGKPFCEEVKTLETALQLQ